MVRRIALPIIFGALVVLVLLWIGQPSPQNKPSPRMSPASSEVTTLVASTSTLGEPPSPDAPVELATRWPDVMPCEQLTTLTIHGFDFERGMPIRWGSIEARAPFTSLPMPLPKQFTPGDYTRLVIAHDLDRYQSITLELACANDRDSGIVWECRRPFTAPLEPARCTVTASYPTRFTPFPLPGTPVARALETSEAVSDRKGWPMQLSHDLVNAATQLVIAGCAGDRCTQVARQFAERLAALRDAGPRELTSVAMQPKFFDDKRPLLQTRWDLADGAVHVSCGSHPLMCSIDREPRSWLMTYTEDYMGVRIDDNAFVALQRGHIFIGEGALRVHDFQK